MSYSWLTAPSQVADGRWQMEVASCQLARDQDYSRHAHSAALATAIWAFTSALQHLMDPQLLPAAAMTHVLAHCSLACRRGGVRRSGRLLQQRQASAGLLHATVLSTLRYWSAGAETVPSARAFRPVVVVVVVVAAAACLCWALRVVQRWFQRLVVVVVVAAVVVAGCR
jgi:hypothetical protein